MLQFTRDELSQLRSSLEELGAQLWYLIENEDLDDKVMAQFRSDAKRAEELFEKIDDYLEKEDHNA